MATVARTRRRWLAAVSSAVVVVSVSTGFATAAHASCPQYAYAGLQSPAAVNGIEAVVAALATPAVAWGHVGGWIGVGGPGQGPNGTNAWLQVGLSSFADDSTSRIYYEIALPGKAKPRYAELDTHVAVGTSHQLAISELPSAPGWWRVLVDNRPVTVAVHIAGSHGRWKAQAFGESWNGGQAVCNASDYSFASLRVAEAGTWTPLVGAQLVQAQAYRITRLANSGFRARFVG